MKKIRKNHFILTKSGDILFVTSLSKYRISTKESTTGDKRLILYEDVVDSYSNITSLKEKKSAQDYFREKYPEYMI